MRVLSIVGARPQFIKLAPISRELDENHQHIIVHTGQHYDEELSRKFFRELEIPEPEYNLGVGSGMQGYQTGEMMKRIEEVLLKERADIVLVYGDTNSTLAGALAAVKLHITIGHIESGLRSFDRGMPEEINRIVTDHISDMLFASTQTAVKNLRREGIEKGVYNCGDVMLDAVFCNMRIAEKKSEILGRLGLNKEGYLLLTIHRVGNTDNKKNLEGICEALLDINEEIVFPVHPRTEKYLRKYGFWNKLNNAENIRILKPVGYLDFLVLEKNSHKIITDSGGVQKEAYFLQVPCITLRENTEWVETVEDGWNVLAGTNKKRIIKAVNEFKPKGEQRNPFGKGKAGLKIVEIISKIHD